MCKADSRRIKGEFKKIIKINMIRLSVGETNYRWSCNNCGDLFNYPRFDLDTKKDRCPACGSSDIKRSRILKR